MSKEHFLRGIAYILETLQRQPSDGYLNQQVENADENRYNEECINLILQNAYSVLEQYLDGNMSESDTTEALMDIYHILGGIKWYKNTGTNDYNEIKYY